MSAVSSNIAAQDNKSLPLSVPRQATPEDLPSIGQLLDTVFSTAKRNVSLTKSFSFIYSPENVANILVVTSGDEVVSTLALWPNEVQAGNARLRVAGLNCVATLPEFRRLGLATHLMRAAVKRMLALRCHMGIVSAMVPNWYRRTGWELGGRLRTYQLNRGNITMLPKLPDNMYIDGATTTTVEEAYGIYCKHAFGGFRSLETFSRQLASRYVTDVLVARASSAPRRTCWPPASGSLNGAAMPPSSPAWCGPGSRGWMKPPRPRAPAPPRQTAWPWSPRRTAMPSSICSIRWAFRAA